MDLNNIDTINMLTRTAKKVSKHYKWLGIQEDFIQEMFVKYIEGRKSTVKQLFIDYLRSEISDPRVENYIPKNKSGQPPKIRFYKAAEFGEELMQQLSENNIQTHNVDFKTITDTFDGDDRTILMLYYKWDMTMKEIGEVIGVNESRVSQKFKVINSKLGKRFGNA